MPKKTQATRKWFDIQAKGQDAVEIYIYGDIGENWWEPEKSNTAEQLIDELAGLKGKNITVRINSYGGSVVDGIAIHNVLMRHQGVVNVEIDAVAYSAASLIAMAGNQIRMAENALLMIHAPWNIAMGNSKEMRRVADVLDKYSDAMVSSYLREGGPDEATIDGWLKDGEDHYFTATEALELGLIDEVTGAVDIAASLNDFNLRGFVAPHSSQAAPVAAKPTKPEGAIMPKSTIPAATTTSADPVNSPATDNVVEIEKAAMARRDAELMARNEALMPIFGMHASKPGMMALKDKILANPAITLDQARAMMLDELGKGAESLSQIDTTISAGLDSRDKNIEAAVSATLARVGLAKADNSNPFRGLRLSELARASLERAGVHVRGMTPEEFAPMALSPVFAAQTSSDFPVILENIMHKLVLSGFKAHAPTWQRFCAVGDVTDFRNWNRLVPGLIGNLDGVDEHGAYRDKSLPDAEKNSIAVTRKGNIISITPETLINDDLGKIQSMANGIGSAGSRTIERAVYTLLVANPVLSDGFALFSAEHGNLAGAGSAPSVATIDAGRVAMSKQQAPGEDQELLDIRPMVGVCSTGLEGAFKSVLGAEYDDETSKNQRKTNTVRNLVEVVGSGRIASSAPWWMFADPNEAPVFEVVFLNGQREPHVSQEMNFRTKGLSFSVELPFGAGAIDYRGGWHNPGA